MQIAVFTLTISQYIDRAHLQTCAAGNAAFRQHNRFAPLRAFDFFNHQSLIIHNSCNRADQSTHATINADPGVDVVELATHPRDCLGWADVRAGSAARAVFQNEVGHLYTPFNPNQVR